MRHGIRRIFVAACCAVAIAATAVWVLGRANRSEEQTLGVTFSTVYARQLGLDPRETFTALLDEVGVRRFRIPVYWSEVEHANGEYRWDDVDWMMGEAAKRGASVTLAVGMKVPRWPECYIPDWAEIEGYPFDREELRDFLRVTVERYRASPALVRWQVENEARFAFGICPDPDEAELAKELELVRSLDDRPVVMTSSGELEWWLPAALDADILGISVYRVTWNRVIGYFRYPIPAAAYRLRAALVRPFVDDVVISELQAEPWLPEPVERRTPAEWYAAFTAEELRANVEYAGRTGIGEADLWGAEWWYFLKQGGEPRLWDEAKRIFL